HENARRGFMRNVEAEIVDIFSSVQGEGIFVGAKQVFVRFKRCNMACVFCDEQKDADHRSYTSISLMEEVESLEDVKKVYLGG
ncbi:MAG: hypothetical protein WCP87_03420, partial [Atribacterota bacterium]